MESSQKRMDEDRGKVRSEHCQKIVVKWHTIDKNRSMVDRFQSMVDRSYQRLIEIGIKQWLSSIVAVTKKVN